MRKELGTAVGELTETRERLDAEVERATTASERADRNAEKLDEVRKGTADEISRLSALTRQQFDNEVLLRIQHEEQLQQAKASAQEELRQAFQKKLEEHEQHARHAIADLEQKAGELRAQIAELDEEAAAAAQEHDKELSQLRSDVVDKEQMVQAAEERQVAASRRSHARYRSIDDAHRTALAKRRRWWKKRKPRSRSFRPDFNRRRKKHNCATRSTSRCTRNLQRREDPDQHPCRHDQSVKHMEENFGRTRDELSRELEQAKVKIGEIT